jgi:hypothetical protein
VTNWSIRLWSQVPCFRLCQMSLYATHNHTQIRSILQVINETIRLANIAPGIFRKAMKDVQFKGVASNLLLHTDCAMKPSAVLLILKFF